MPWRAYFPDLWVDGFPNLDDATMKRITQECTKREETLLPKLRKTTTCGINRGCDRYWEFALDPVFDVSLISSQVEILKANDLLPGDMNSLHITLGGIRRSRNVYFIALVVEALCSTPDRVRSAFLSDTMSKGWGRKGRAGIFEKEGSHDMQHGYTYGSEIRTGQMPPTVEELHQILDIVQRMAVQVHKQQQADFSELESFNRVIDALTDVLIAAGLPDTNWGNPHANPTVWHLFAEKLPSLKRPVLEALELLE